MSFLDMVRESLSLVLNHLSTTLRSSEDKLKISAIYQWKVGLTKNSRNEVITNAFHFIEARITCLI